MDLLVKTVVLVVVEQEQVTVEGEQVIHLQLVHLKVIMVEQELTVNQTLDVHLPKRVVVAVEQTLQEQVLLVQHLDQKLQVLVELVLLIQLQDLL